MSTLQQFPIDTIRIQRSFIHDRLHYPNDAALAAALIALARSLSLTVIAEGIASEAQSDVLHTQVSDQFQGFLTDQPLPAEDFAQWLRQQVER